MRKFLLFALLMVGMTAGAQDWKIKKVEGDVMLGQKESIVYEWREADGVFRFSDDSNAWSVSGAAFKPDATHVNGNQNFETYARIGFYDSSDRLVEMFSDCVLELTNVYQTATSYAKPKKRKGQYAVTEYLKNGTGYVRIIIPKMTSGNFDISVPCMGAVK